MSFVAPWNAGDDVEVRRHRAGGSDDVIHKGVVKAVGARVVVLADDSKWRAVDGYAWGSKPERGVGRFFAARIVRTVST